MRDLEGGPCTMSIDLELDTQDVSSIAEKGDKKFSLPSLTDHPLAIVYDLCLKHHYN